MKKLLLVLAIGAFAACNDSATTETTETTIDTTTIVTVDTLSTSADTTMGARVDSIQATPAH